MYDGRLIERGAPKWFHKNIHALTEADIGGILLTKSSRPEILELPSKQQDSERGGQIKQNICMPWLNYTIKEKKREFEINAFI